MNNKLLCCLTFIFGAALGGAASYLYVKKQADEQIRKNNEEARKYYDEKVNEFIEETTKKVESLDEALEKVVTNDTPQNSYSNYYDTSTNNEEETVKLPKPSYMKDDIENYKKILDTKISSSEAYVIDPELYGELENYKLISLNLYKDGVLADNDNEIVDDYESLLGNEWKESFGIYSNKAVYVRNDIRRCDYEILLVNSNFY